MSRGRVPIQARSLSQAKPGPRRGTGLVRVPDQARSPVPDQARAHGQVPVPVPGPVPVMAMSWSHPWKGPVTAPALYIGPYGALEGSSVLSAVGSLML